MGVHLLAVIGKLNFFFNGHCLTPVVAGLAWPFFVLKVTWSFRPIREAYNHLIYATTLFFFQLRQIYLGSDSSLPGERWERALRLVCQRLIGAAPAGFESEDESLRALSMLAL